MSELAVMGEVVGLLEHGGGSGRETRMPGQC